MLITTGMSSAKPADTTPPESAKERTELPLAALTMTPRAEAMVGFSTRSSSRRSPPAAVIASVVVGAAATSAAVETPGPVLVGLKVSFAP